MDFELNICPPALIYIAFSVTQIIIDLFKGLYNAALIKFFVMAVIGFLLNILCQGGLSIISWIIVFIPFALMTVIVAMLLYIFGLKASTGTLDDGTFSLTGYSPEKKTPDDPVQSIPACDEPYYHGLSRCY